VKGMRLVLVSTVLLAGFFAGAGVQAGSGEPGSTTDPLASQSYVHRAVSDKVAALQQQVAALQQQVNELDNGIAELERIIDSGGAVIEEDIQPGQARAYFLERKVTVYQEPDSDSRGVAELAPNQDFAVLELKDGWYHVELPGGKKGWIKAKYVVTQ